jgi:hypothetical protein
MLEERKKIANSVEAPNQFKDLYEEGFPDILERLEFSSEAMEVWEGSKWCTPPLMSRPAFS